MTTICLRAENLTEYGIDIYGKQRLQDLIKLIDSYEEVKYILLFPIGLSICEITDEILDAICNIKKIVPNIALNLEVGSNRLLKLIEKNHTRERAIHIFKELRKAHPNTYISTSIMIGFPTETLTDIYDVIISYPKIFKKGKRSTYRFQKECEERWQKYSLLSIPRKEILLEHNF